MRRCSEKLHLDQLDRRAILAIMSRELLHGDLGISLYTNRPVDEDIAQFLPATLELVFVAGLMIVVLGLPLGVLSARYRGHLADIRDPARHAPRRLGPGLRLGA